MKEIWMSALALLFVVSINHVFAQAPHVPQHLPRGKAVFITSAEIQAVAQKQITKTTLDRALADAPPATKDAVTKAVAKTLDAGTDEVLAMLPLKAGPNYGVSVLHYAVSEPGKNPTEATEHSKVSELYYVIQGNATLITGGDLGEPYRDTTTGRAAGASAFGVMTGNSVSRKIGPGDVIIIPPNTPHLVNDVTQELVFLVMRIDPDKVLMTKER
jgi:mannose-6-phosphate isomerase-like protein (cupin superfamily)